MSEPDREDTIITFTLVDNKGGIRGRGITTLEEARTTAAAAVADSIGDQEVDIYEVKFVGKRTSFKKETIKKIPPEAVEVEIKP